MQKSLAALISAFFALTSTTAQAGAWLQKPEETQVILSYSYMSTDEFFDPSGDKFNNISFSKGEFSPYFEHGLNEDWTIGASLSLQNVSSNGVGSNVQDVDNYLFASTDIFARTYLWQGADYVVSLEPRLNIPLEQDAGINPEGSAPIPELRISYGTPKTLLGYEGFTDLSLTYRLRSDDNTADMIKFDSSVGISLSDEIPLTLLAQSFYEHTLTNISTNSSSGNYNLLKLQLSMIYEYDENVRLQLGGFSNILGKNTAAGNGLILSTLLSF